MTHFCSAKVTHPKSMLVTDRLLGAKKMMGIIIHAEGVLRTH